MRTGTRTTGTSRESIERAATFIKNFANEQAISLPGSYPNVTNRKVKLLLSAETKASVRTVQKGLRREELKLVISNL